MKHEWVDGHGRLRSALGDESHHGSLFWVCRFCDTPKYRAEPDCPKAEECLGRESHRKEMAERYEYENLKRQHDRWEYLRDKYEKESFLIMEK